MTILLRASLETGCKMAVWKTKLILLTPLLFYLVYSVLVIEAYPKVVW